MRIEDFQKVTIEGTVYYILYKSVFQTHFILEQSTDQKLGIVFIVNTITRFMRELYRGIATSGKFAIIHNQDKEIEEILSIHNFLMNQVYSSEEKIIVEKNDILFFGLSD